MAHTSGVSANTAKRQIYGAGVWIKNYDKTKTIAEQAANILGATTGGNTFVLHQKTDATEFDGQLGPVKGAVHLVEDYATGAGTIKDIPLATLMTQIPGATFVDASGKASITRSRDIADSDYIGNIALICDHTAADGSVGFILSNVLGGDDSLTIKTVDKAAASVELAWTSHYDPSAMATRPWEILWPGNTVIPTS